MTKPLNYQELSFIAAEDPKNGWRSADKQPLPTKARLIRHLKIRAYLLNLID